MFSWFSELLVGLSIHLCLISHFKPVVCGKKNNEKKIGHLSAQEQIITAYLCIRKGNSKFLTCTNRYVLISSFRNIK